MTSEELRQQAAEALERAKETLESIKSALDAAKTAYIRALDNYVELEIASAVMRANVRRPRKDDIDLDIAIRQIKHEARHARHAGREEEEKSIMSLLRKMTDYRQRRAKAVKGITVQ